MGPKGPQGIPGIKGVAGKKGAAPTFIDFEKGTIQYNDGTYFNLQPEQLERMKESIATTIKIPMPEVAPLQLPPTEPPRPEKTKHHYQSQQAYPNHAPQAYLPVPDSGVTLTFDDGTVLNIPLE